MSETNIAAYKVRAYRATDYRLGHTTQDIVLAPGLRSDRLAELFASKSVTCGAFLTAFNPHRVFSRFNRFRESPGRCCPHGFWGLYRDGLFNRPGSQRPIVAIHRGISGSRGDSCRHLARPALPFVAIRFA